MNWLESYFARLRRAEAEHHHEFAGIYLIRYAQEAGWGEDYGRLAGRVLGLAMAQSGQPGLGRVLAAGGLLKNLSHGG